MGPGEEQSRSLCPPSVEQEKVMRNQKFLSQDFRDVHEHGGLEDIFTGCHLV